MLVSILCIIHMYHDLWCILMHLCPVHLCAPVVDATAGLDSVVKCVAWNMTTVSQTLALTEESVSMQ